MNCSMCGQIIEQDEDGVYADLAVVVDFGGDNEKWYHLDCWRDDE